jgi:hypothetical protein
MRQQQFKIAIQHSLPALEYRDGAWWLRLELEDSGRVLFEEDAFASLEEIERWLLDFVRTARALIKDARASMADAGVLEAHQ